MKIKFSFQIRWLLLFILTTNILMLFGTWLHHYHFYYVLNGTWAEAAKLEYLIVQFSLANENNLATWYSSMLFLFVALTSLSCFLIQKQKNTKEAPKFLNYGWLMFFLIFAALSYDEIASMHERIGNIHALNPFSDGPPGWILILSLPIAIVAFLMLWFCWIQVKRAPRAVGFAVAGIFLFLTIPVQELVETNAWHSSANPDAWQRPVLLLLIEEGSELFGATFMFISTLIFAHSASNPGQKLSLSKKLRLKFHLNRSNSLRWVTSCLVLLGFIMISVETSTLLAAKGDIGVSRNWFPSALAFLITLLSFYKIKKFGASSRAINSEDNFSVSRHPDNNRDGKESLKKGIKKDQNNSGLKLPVYIYLALFSLFLSAYFGSNIYVYLWIFQGGIFQIIFLILFSLITIFIGAHLFLNTKGTLAKAGVIVWTLFTIITLGIYNEYSAVLAYLAFSILLLTQISQLFKNPYNHEIGVKPTSYKFSK